MQLPQSTLQQSPCFVHILKAENCTPDLMLLQELADLRSIGHTLWTFAARSKTRFWCFHANAKENLFVGPKRHIHDMHGLIIAPSLTFKY